MMLKWLLRARSRDEVRRAAQSGGCAEAAARAASEARAAANLVCFDLTMRRVSSCQECCRVTLQSHVAESRWQDRGTNGVCSISRRRMMNAARDQQALGVDHVTPIPELGRRACFYDSHLL